MKRRRFEQSADVADQHVVRGGAHRPTAMPAWAQDDPHAYWQEGDAHERANGRLYSEVQFALPRELDASGRRYVLHTSRETAWLGETPATGWTDPRSPTAPPPMPASPPMGPLIVAPLEFVPPQLRAMVPAPRRDCSDRLTGTH